MTYLKTDDHAITINSSSKWPGQFKSKKCQSLAAILDPFQFQGLADEQKGSYIIHKFMNCHEKYDNLTEWNVTIHHLSAAACVKMVIAKTSWPQRALSICMKIVEEDMSTMATFQLAIRIHVQLNSPLDVIIISNQTFRQSNKGEGQETNVYLRCFSVK